MSSDKSKEKRIKTELNKLKKIFANVPENKKKITENLLKNAAFMALSLGELQEEINQNGYTDEYRNGEFQFGKKQSEAVKTHLAMQKNYVQVIDKLLELLPEDERKQSRLAAFRNEA